MFKSCVSRQMISSVSVADTLLQVLFTGEVVGKAQVLILLTMALFCVSVSTIMCYTRTLKLDGIQPLWSCNTCDVSKCLPLKGCYTIQCRGQNELQIALLWNCFRFWKHYCAVTWHYMDTLVSLFLCTSGTIASTNLISRLNWHFVSRDSYFIITKHQRSWQWFGHLEPGYCINLWKIS